MNYPIQSSPRPSQQTTQHCLNTAPNSLLFQNPKLFSFSIEQSLDLSHQNPLGFGLTIPYGAPPVYQKVLTDVTNAKQGKQDRPTVLRQIKRTTPVMQPKLSLSGVGIQLRYDTAGLKEIMLVACLWNLINLSYDHR